MSTLAIKKEVLGSVDEVCERVSEAIKPIGFGILTRIDFDQKIKEKLNETISRTVILGACHPKLAFEAFKQSTDVALLIPCNIVVREIEKGRVVVEAMRPSKMLDFLSDVSKSEMIEMAEANLERVVLAL
jgi:uncharacterized protein (DUF302 family)